MSLSVLSKLKEGNAPLNVRQSAARGVLPVGQEELLGIPAYQVMKFQIIAPMTALKTTSWVECAESTSPVAIV